MDLFMHMNFIMDPSSLHLHCRTTHARTLMERSWRHHWENLSGVCAKHVGNFSVMLAKHCNINFNTNRTIQIQLNSLNTHKQSYYEHTCKSDRSYSHRPARCMLLSIGMTKPANWRDSVYIAYTKLHSQNFPEYKHFSHVVLHIVYIHNRYM